jgi:maleate isomerase
MEADAVFICCGALRSLDITEKLENKLSKPVVTSIQAMVWNCLRQAGVYNKIKGYGKLFNS